MPPMPPHAPLTPEQLFARLDALGIPHRTYTHPPVFTVAEAAALRGSLPGGHCKSLFLKDRKGGLWLVVALEERRIDLKLLADSLGAPRFSFGSPELLREVLGVAPGSVTPFALANDTAQPGRGRARQGDAGARPAQLSSARQRPHHRDRAGRSAAVYRGLRPPSRMICRSAGGGADARRRSPLIVASRAWRAQDFSLNPVSPGWPTLVIAPCRRHVSSGIPGRKLHGE